jgi:hypothetical protein
VKMSSPCCLVRFISQEGSVIMLMSLDDIDVCVACKKKCIYLEGAGPIYLFSTLHIIPGDSP